MIPAKVCSDNRARSVEFDATDYFKQANLQDLIDLLDCDFAIGFAANAVALFFEEEDTRINELMDYCRALKPGLPLIGFECSIDQEAAFDWLEENRPELLDQLAQYLDW